MNKHEYLREWVALIQEYKLNDKQDRDILEKLGERNYRVLYHELKSVETLYLQVWQKFTNNEAYRELFLGKSAFLAVLYLEFDRLNEQRRIAIRHLHDRQTKILFKRIKIEQENENTNDLFKERNKLADEKNDLYNERNQEINLLLSSRLELKTARKEFLQSLKRYVNSFEKDFLECSDNYARLLSKITAQKSKIRNWEKTHSYRIRLKENYMRYSILGDRLFDSAVHV